MSELLLTDRPSSADAGRRPMMVVDDAHVNYRVYASGKRMSARDSILGPNAIRGGRGLTTIPALRGVSFTASEGETIGVVGHNGSGKSTLFKAMTGLIPTAEGAIWARDRPVLLGVNAALMPELSGENNIKLGLLAMGFTAEEAAAQVDEIADFAELNEFIYHPMRTYSSGMGARLRFAIASAKAHSILLVDEALAVGDRRFRAKSEERIRELRDSAGLVMIVSHSVGSLKDTCERVLWIHKGELLADGPADAVIDEYVAWTKKPGGGAVGAASAFTPKTVNRLQAPLALGASTPSDTGSEGSSGIATLEAMLAASVPVAAAAADAPPGSRQRSEGTGESTSTGSVRHPTPRDLARRTRFRRDAREKVRRRILVLATTGAVLLIAVGAGVAIAFLAGAPRPADVVPTPERTIEAVVVSPPPTIPSFTAAAATASCAAEEGDVEIRLSWEVKNASVVAVATGSAPIDAIDAPLLNGLPVAATDQVVPYSCVNPSQVYTLTAQNPDGARISSVVTVAREIVVAPEPDTDTDNSQRQPQRGPSNPVEPAPAPAPEPVPETDPAPAPQPEETTPREETTPPEVPKPEIPAPVPTDVIPDAGQPIETQSP
ncbi:ABC transporter ATP-binding protein [uncultured Microbacterium sp.]|uniref:ABC transporter ATP-binding protein n=1 Tax=uncultured Microbacterium sp. TaxID=191216 RepID=UPI00259548FE|nr:ABC transporter ATP-binding protein [uncultured Microbacterium sp.]